MVKHQFLLKFTTISLIISILISYNVLALSNQQEAHYIDNNILFYNPDNNLNCFSVSYEELKDQNISENVGKISDLLIDKMIKDVDDNIDQSMAKIFTAAILGNMKWESEYNPYNLNKKDCTSSKSSCNASYGLSQWRAERFVSLMKFAGEYDKWDQKNFDKDGWKDESFPKIDIKTQIDYLYKELKSDYKNSVFDKILNLKNQNLTYDEQLKEATYIYGRYFEAFDGSHIKDNEEHQRRFLMAQKIGRTFNKSSDNCFLPTPNLGKFVNFLQTDIKWKDKPYAGETIGHSGCGPTSLTTILTNLKIDTSLNPSKMVDIIRDNQDIKVEYDGQGSSIWGLVQLSHRVYSTKHIYLGTDKDKIQQALDNGYMIITTGRGPIPYTEGGHIFPILGINEDGKWVIGQTVTYLSDPGLKGWDPDELIGAGMRDSYGIKKE